MTSPISKYLYYDHDGITIYCGDCREILPHLGPVDLVLTDPPYNGVLSDEWDNQWGCDEDFMVWLNGVLKSLDRISSDNATFYVFSSPRLSARIEVQMSRRFKIIGSAVWDKGSDRKGAGGSGVDIASLRTYWTANTERIIIAEKMVGDDAAKDNSGYWASCEAAKRSVIGNYLKSEFLKAGVSNRRIAALFPSKTGGTTGCVSNWLLGLNCPTKDQYETIRTFLNTNGSEYLRREYEDLRRPFFLTKNDQWGDVWRFNIERNRLHPAQKPLPLVSQMIRVSSRQSSIILDPFMGSGTTLVAAKQLRRKAIGIEIEEKYCAIAKRRLAQGVLDFEK